MNKLREIFSHKDLRKRLLFVFGLLVITRLVAHVPIPGVDIDQLKNFFQQNQVFGLVNLFSGGGLRNFSIAMMGVGPYITSSIIMQLLTMAVPKLEQLQKEGGEQGRRKIAQYTRLLTVPLAGLQSLAMVRLLQSQQVGGQPLIGHFSLSQWLMTVIVMVAGTMLLMWLGELITENGVGNGISIIIFTGIVAGLPTAIGQSFAASLGGAAALQLALVAILVFVIVYAIVYITEGQRNIPVTYARRVSGLQSNAASNTHLPLRVNQAGVIPIIFAISLVLLPGIYSQYFQNSKSHLLHDSAVWLGNVYSTTKPWYWLTYFLLVVLFSYFYTSVIFNPKNVSENIQQQGGFIPGIRPGTETQNYLKFILNRITLIGGVFLGLVAVLPFLLQFIVPDVKTLTIGGTSILIVISVILETMKQIQAQLLMRQYDHYQRF